LKNSMVANIYNDLGFDLVLKKDDGSTHWELLVEKFKYKKTSIKIK